MYVCQHVCVCVIKCVYVQSCACLCGPINLLFVSGLSTLQTVVTSERQYLVRVIISGADLALVRVLHVLLTVWNG
jgi:hypothetical protein